jgi:drug/metabolite transporter (DMT)-like permease
MDNLLADIMIYFIYILLCLIWGSTWLAIKIGLADSPAFWSAGIRFLLASIIIFMINIWRRKKYPRALDEIWRILLPGIFMYAVSYMLVYKAEQLIDSSLTAVLFTSFPFMVAGFAILMLREEKLSLSGWLGLSLGLAGTVAIFYDSLVQSKFIFLGSALALAGSAASAYGTVYVRAHLIKYDIAVIASMQMTLGAIIMIAAALIFEPLESFEITSKSVGALLYLSTFGTVVAFLGYYRLLQKMKAITVSQITFITPLIAVILGYIFLAEKMTVMTAAGAVLVLAGVAMVIRK